MAKSVASPAQVLGIGVAGLGVGEQHARAYARLENCKLRWMYDLDPARMDRVRADLGQGAPARSFQDMLDDPDVDVISIASYDDAHFEQVVAALAAGKHIFVEKPLCESQEQLRAVRESWEKSDSRKLASNLVLRAAPLYVWLRKKIHCGDLGEIYGFDGDYLYGRVHKITHGWRKDVENYSVLRGGGVHLVDLMLWLTGQKPAFVTTLGNRICTKGTAFRYHDFMAATFQFPSGLVGRVTANFGCMHRHQHAVRVFGTRATFIYDDCGARLHTSRDPLAAPERVDLSPLPTSKGDLIPGFVESIFSGRDTREETQHEFDVLSVCTLADRALFAKSALEIEYV